jgi:hypothetical protein
MFAFYLLAKNKSFIALTAPLLRAIGTRTVRAGPAAD